jgi:hypothetical protein
MKEYVIKAINIFYSLQFIAKDNILSDINWGMNIEADSDPPCLLGVYEVDDDDDVSDFEGETPCMICGEVEYSGTFTVSEYDWNKLLWTDKDDR